MMRLEDLGPSVAALHAERQPHGCLICGLPPKRGRYLHPMCGHPACEKVLKSAQQRDSKAKRKGKR
jgi:hypothetical protein